MMMMTLTTMMMLEYVDTEQQPPSRMLSLFNLQLIPHRLTKITRCNNDDDS